MNPLLVDLNGSDADAIVVGIPPAAAGLGYFAPWRRPLAPVARLHAVRLPGRDDFWDEDLIDDAEEILDRLTGEIAALPAADLALVGCCSGGLLAFELTHRLCRAGRVRPVLLVLNGTVTPPSLRPPYMSAGSGESLRAYYEQTEDEPFPDEVWELVEPRIRSDMLAVERCAYTTSALPTPMVTVRGRDDTFVGPDETRSWRRWAGAGIEHREISGGHFLMNDAPAEFAAEMLSALARHRTAPG